MLGRLHSPPVAADPSKQGAHTHADRTSQPESLTTLAMARRCAMSASVKSVTASPRRPANEQREEKREGQRAETGNGEGESVSTGESGVDRPQHTREAHTSA